MRLKCNPQARSSVQICAILGTDKRTDDTIMPRPRQWTICALTGLLACVAAGESTPASQLSAVDADEPQASQDIAESALLGTSRDPEASPAMPEHAATISPPPAPSDSAALPLNLTWKHVRFTEAGMELDLIDGAHSTHAWPKGGVLQQAFKLEDSEGQSLQLLIRAGEGVSLASLRADRESEDTLTSPLTKATTCGQASQHIEFAAPRLDIQCVIYGDGRPNGPSTVPPMTTVAESFRYEKLDVVVSWRLPTSLRERYREDERRFFASLRCADQPHSGGE